MAHINQNYLKLPGSYLFSEVNRRITAYSASHPGAKIIRLSIGDVTRPLAPAVIEAMHQAVTEMGTFEGFHGYGPEQGYDFLREAIGPAPPGSHRPGRPWRWYRHRQGTPGRTPPPRCPDRRCRQCCRSRSWRRRRQRSPPA